MQSTKERQQKQTNTSNQLEHPRQSSKEQTKSLPHLQRKFSKRREVQEQRVIVLDLFKQLFTKINQGYAQVNALRMNKNTHIKTPRISKHKIRGKEATIKQKKQSKDKKNAQQQNRLRVQKKEQIWTNYSVLMRYQIIMPELEIRPPTAIIDEAHQ